MHTSIQYLYPIRLKFCESQSQQELRMKPSSSKRKSGEALDADKRLKIVSELAALNGQSKMGLVKTLKALHDKGLLVDALVEAPTELGYRRQVRRAFEEDALYAQTPYGPMLNHMELPVVDEKLKAKRPSMWDINPFAPAMRNECCIIQSYKGCCRYCWNQSASNSALLRWGKSWEPSGSRPSATVASHILVLRRFAKLVPSQERGMVLFLTYS